jgi:multidrug efflux pump subunit AcrA (membrane-fusion protein)
MRKQKMTKPHTIAAAMAAALLIAGCGEKTAPPPPRGQNVTLTEAQRQKITLYTVARRSYRKEVDTSGTVDFDNNQATPVMAPFGGPVSRILVEQGQVVKKGDALAAVVSPDYATTVSTYRKALSPPRMRASWPTWTRTCWRTRASRPRKRNRPRPMPPAPRLTATPRCRPCSPWMSLRR